MVHEDKHLAAEEEAFTAIFDSKEPRNVTFSEIRSMLSRTDLKRQLTELRAARKAADEARFVKIRNAHFWRLRCSIKSNDPKQLNGLVALGIICQSSHQILTLGDLLSSLPETAMVTKNALGNGLIWLVYTGLMNAADFKKHFEVCKAEIEGYTADNPVKIQSGSLNSHHTLVPDSSAYLNPSPRKGTLADRQRAVDSIATSRSPVSQTEVITPVASVNTTPTPTEPSTAEEPTSKSDSNPLFVEDLSKHLSDFISEQSNFSELSVPRPPLFDMTAEERAATTNYDFAAEDARQQKSQREAQPTRPDRKDNDTAKHLASLLERERMLADAATRPVVFSLPLISRNDTGLIGRGTINIIQGAYGSHKSRLAELLASLLLSQDPDNPQFLGFVRAELERFCVCYIDTERNQSEELPFSIQGIKTRAGYTLADQPTEFRFTSIKAVDRPARFAAIEAFISHVRANTILHLFCLIDVVTDAVGDFNDAKESMKLYDFIGNLCDRHNATFLLVIHQNPGTEKARGHTGTEAANKASTALQIGFEKDASGNDTDLIRLKYLKLRRGKRPEPLYLTFCKESNGLILADAANVAAHVNHRKHKADAEDIADRLCSLLSEGALPKNEVWTILENEFKASNATIRERIKSIMDNPSAMFDDKGRAVTLGHYKEGRNPFFRLNPVV